MLVTQVISSCSTTSNHVPEGATQAGKPVNNQQWLCAADKEQQWQCVDLNQVQAAGSALKTMATRHTATDAPTTSIDPSPVVSAAVTDNKTAKEADNNSHDNANSKLNSYLDKYPDNYWAAQLIAARSQQTIDDFLQQHPQLALQQLTTKRAGQRWHHLILGPFSNYQEAQAAIASIDSSLSTAPWIRTLGPLKANLVASTP